NYQTSDKGDVSFDYTKPGRYFISLIGLDTVYNLFTQQYEACSNTFPDKLFQKDTNRSVLVLPLNETGIQGPDTVCINSTVLYTSLSDTAYKRDLWSFSDTSNVIDTIIRASIIKHFDKAGVHSIFLKPQYLNALNNTCLDSARKDVFVIGVKSLFSIDPV